MSNVPYKNNDKNNEMVSPSGSKRRAAAWVVIASVYAVLACDGIRYLRVKESLSRGVNKVVAEVESRPRLLKTLAFARPSANNQKWTALQNYEKAMIAAGASAAIEGSGLTNSCLVRMARSR